MPHSFVKEKNLSELINQYWDRKHLLTTSNLLSYPKHSAGGHAALTAQSYGTFQNQGKQYKIINYVYIRIEVSTCATYRIYIYIYHKQMICLNINHKSLQPTDPLWTVVNFIYASQRPEDYLQIGFMKEH